MKTSQYRSIMMVCWMTASFAAENIIVAGIALFFNIAYAIGFVYSARQESKK